MGNCKISLFSKPKFEFHIQSPDEHAFQIQSDTAFTIQGYCALSEHTDTCCCEQVWNDFYELENVFLTPHIAGSQANEVARMSELVVDQFENMLNGKPTQYEVTEQMLATMA